MLWQDTTVKLYLNGLNSVERLVDDTIKRVFLRQISACLYNEPNDSRILEELLGTDEGVTLHDIINSHDLDTALFALDIIGRTEFLADVIERLRKGVEDGIVDNESLDMFRDLLACGRDYRGKDLLDFYNSLPTSFFNR